MHCESMFSCTATLICIMAEKEFTEFTVYGKQLPWNEHRGVLVVLLRLDNMEHVRRSEEMNFKVMKLHYLEED